MLIACQNMTIPIVDKNFSATSSDWIFFPTVSSNVTLSLTLFYVVIYCIVFLSVYVQLWMILHFNYKLISFQSVFLFLCLFWSGLRAILFSFYIHNTMTATELSPFFYWLLYSFPICLQFCTLCLLNLYFSQVMFKSISKYAANPNRYIFPLRAASLLAVTLFLVMNITCAVVVYKEATSKDPLKDAVRAIVFARVLINDVLFVICAISLAYSFFKISKTTSANILLESKGITVRQAVSVGIVIVLLYVSRSLYNLIAISPLRCPKSSKMNFKWYNVSDQADLADLNKDMSYVVFGVVLFIWEFLPTFLTILFFKVSKPGTSAKTNNGNFDVNCHTSRAYFFDTPRDSDDDIGEPSSFRAVSTRRYH